MPVKNFMALVLLKKKKKAMTAMKKKGEKKKMMMTMIGDLVFVVVALVLFAGRQTVAVRHFTKDRELLCWWCLQKNP